MPAAPTSADAARGMEALFLRQMLSAMRGTGSSDPLTGSAAERQFRELFDAQIAENISQHSGGIGIGAAITRQLGEETR